MHLPEGETFRTISQDIEPILLALPLFAEANLSPIYGTVKPQTGRIAPCWSSESSHAGVERGAPALPLLPGRERERERERSEPWRKKTKERTPQETRAQGECKSRFAAALPGWLDFLSRRLPGQGRSLHASMPEGSWPSRLTAPVRLQPP